MSALPSSLLPMWTKRVAADAGGRDPLGLSRVSDVIKNFLITGINSNNSHARYYSFYCWALWHIEQVENLNNYEDFISAFRRREATMALASFAHNPATSPIGVKTVKLKFNDGNAEGIYDCDFKVLDDRLGGYGHYYSGSLYYLGLYHRPEGFDKVTPGTAHDLAEAYHATIKHTPYIRKKIHEASEIAQNDLSKSQEFLSLDALLKPFAQVEREKLIEIFFGFNDQTADQSTILRRHTLTLLLHAVAEHERLGTKAIATKTSVLDEYLLYAFYYGVIWIDEAAQKKTVPYHAPESLMFCRELWRQFCLHQFLSQALELLLCGVLEALSIDVLSLTLEEIIAELLKPEFFTELEEIAGRKCDMPSDLLAAFGLTDIPDKAASQSLQNRLLPTHPLSEAQILNYDHSDAPTLAARGILLLTALYGKWRGATADHALAYVRHRAGNELWIGTILPHLDGWFDKTKTWHTALKDLVEGFILRQHDQIMYEKGKLDSCWLDRRDGRIFKVQDYEPVWRSSRHLNGIKIMRDLGLVQISDESELSLTSQGRRIMEKSLKHSHGET